MRHLTIIVVVVLLAVSSLACDRDESATDDPPADQQQADEQPDEQPDDYDDDSLYPELQDVDPIEPTDAGPEAPAIYFTSGLKGYTEPCGCTADVLLGGIDRITAFVRDARQLHPEAVMIDAGDWLFEIDEIPEHLQAQEKAKAEVLAGAHRRMDTEFSVPGNRDLALGVDFYAEMMDKAQMTPLGANIDLDGESLKGAKKLELDSQKLLFVGAGDPDSYDAVDGVDVTDDEAAIRDAVGDTDADGTVLVYQGSAIRAHTLAESVDEIDFVIVGHDPRRQQDAQPAGDAQLLEAYDQGRYVGRLKLYGTEHQRPFEDGRAGVLAERQSLDNQIDGVRTDLRRLEVRTEGRRTSMTERLEERLDDLEQQRAQLLDDGVEIPDDSPAFLYDLIGMEPGYRLDDAIEQKRRAYNERLADFIDEIDREPIAPRDDEPFFVGQDTCADCHGDAHDFWKQTSHASAVETLEVRQKQYDQNCIGCHVDGWEQPGGSVLGNIKYEAELGGEIFTKDLHEVGCESCHGPGSDHVLDPLDDDAQPQHINRHPDANDCTQCHVPDHSPTFDFEVYVDQITGEGHEYTGGDN